MKKNSKSRYPPSVFLDRLLTYEKNQEIPKKVLITLEHFFHNYINALADNGKDIADYVWIFLDYLERIKEQIRHPFTFDLYHKMVRTPYDYYQFGLDFIKPLVHLECSTLQGQENLKQIQDHIKNGHNVILLSNHQIEADPIAIFILLETYAPDLIDKLISVAGERVIIDPLAVPFSLGCNLLCIYSKRYIDHPPEKKSLKQHHNNRTMKLMKHLLDEGGHCIYVAPSGGRDRPNEEGIIKPSPFDPQSIEMFYLMAKHSQRPTFFYTLALSTYSVLPPPETIQTEVGEHRKASVAAIHLFFGKHIDMEHFPNSDLKDKHLRRKARSDYIYNLVNKDYNQLL